jgi:hypothetical protein
MDKICRYCGSEEPHLIGGYDACIYCSGLAKKVTDKKKKELLDELSTNNSFIDFCKKKDNPITTSDETLSAIIKYYGSYEILEALEIDGVVDSEGGYLFVGSTWDSIGDDETGKQFKERVIKEVSEDMDTKGLTVNTICEVIYG